MAALVALMALLTTHAGSLIHGPGGAMRSKRRMPHVLPHREAG